MRRYLALLLISALFILSGVVSSLHTHAYTDHEHPEHHQGLAAHEHEAAPLKHEDVLTHVEGCDPGQHTVSVAFLCAVPPLLYPLDPESVVPPLLRPPAPTALTVAYLDLRVHGPPPRTQASPRAPPLITHT